VRPTDLHATALAMRQSRGKDWIAAVVMIGAFLAGMFLFQCFAISVLDWLDDKPNSVVPALMAFLETIDGVRR